MVSTLRPKQRTLRLPVQYIRAYAEGDQFVEENFHHRQAALEVPAAEVALVLVDVWNLGFGDQPLVAEEGFFGEYNGGRSFPARAQRITLERIQPALEAARAAGVECVINASTGGAILGDATPPIHENMPARPLAPYGAAKLAAEGYCSAFTGAYGLPTVSLRFSNVYGPLSFHKGSVVAHFFKCILAGEDLVIYLSLIHI